MIIEPYRWHRVSIQALAPASCDTISLTLLRPKGYDYRAGQYTIIRLTTSAGHTILRQYSFSSAPHDPHLECTIQREEGGEASMWFFEHARPGDTIEISQAFGQFVWDPFATRPLLFIAGRVGIAPFMSMIRDHKGEKQSVSVLYSVNTSDQVCFAQELQELKTTVCTTSNGQRITADVIAPHLHDSPLVYICGSRQFVEAMQEHLIALHVEPSDIRRESFTL